MLDQIIFGLIVGALIIIIENSYEENNNIYDINSIDKYIFIDSSNNKYTFVKQ